MAVLTTGHTFVDGQQVTSTRLNNTVNAATFASAAVDGTTTQLSSGAIIVKDLGISTGKIAASAVTTAKLATNSVSTAKIIDSNVTKAKIEDFTNLTVLGNVSGSAATPAEVTIIDDDTMGTASAATLATSESIKAYVDTQIGDNNDLSEILANGNTTGANNIIVTAGQSIGIGAASPAKNLHIASNANSQSTAAIPGIRIENTDTTATADNVVGEIEFFSKDASEADKISGFIKNVAEDPGTDYALTFGAKATGFNATEAMRINNAGNVGIGTTGPGQKLEVNGGNRHCLKWVMQNLVVL